MNGAISLGLGWFIDSVLKHFHIGKAYNATTSLDNKVMLDHVNETE